MTDADWSIEMFEDDDGKCPVESWMDKLDEVTYAALSAAIEYVLAPSGISLASSQWLTPLNGGLYEFRVRHTAEEIQAMFARAGREAPKNPAKILLRLFVAFHGQKVILLLDGCDKLEDSSESRQQKEIAKARKLLKAWHLQQAKEKKAKKKGRSGGRERCLDRPESRCVGSRGKLTVCVRTHNLFGRGDQHGQELCAVRREAACPPVGRGARGSEGLLGGLPSRRRPRQGPS